MDKGAKGSRKYSQKWGKKGTQRRQRRQRKDVQRGHEEGTELSTSDIFPRSYGKGYNRSLESQKPSRGVVADQWEACFRSGVNLTDQLANINWPLCNINYFLSEFHLWLRWKFNRWIIWTVEVLCAVFDQILQRDSLFVITLMLASETPYFSQGSY